MFLDDCFKAMSLHFGHCLLVQQIAKQGILGDQNVTTMFNYK